MINRWILLLMISTALVSTEEYLPDGNVSAEKRSPMEFQPMRGKTSLTSWDREELSKRALMGFQGMRGKKNSIIAEAENQLFPAETNKRAPMGFQAMRGKKSLEEILNEIDKRAIGEFDGSMGKEMYSIDYTDDYDARRTKKDQLLREWEKKAPMGFQGMRGKKMVLDKLEQLDGRGVIDFQGIHQNMRDTLDNYFDYSISPSDYEKRDTYYSKGAQNAGEPFKRAPMRFHGMRGKRDAIEGYKSNSRTTGTLTRYYQGTSKRGNDLATYELEKRSPFGYLAARGKKNPRWEFRGKFVGVRGKKSSSALQTAGQNRNRTITALLLLATTIITVQW